MKERKATLDNVVMRYGLEKTEPFFGEGRPLFNAVCKLDLEGIVAKKLDDPYEPGRTKWWKVPQVFFNASTFAPGRKQPSHSPNLNLEQ